MHQKSTRMRNRLHRIRYGCAMRTPSRVVATGCRIVAVVFAMALASGCGDSDSLGADDRDAVEAAFLNYVATRNSSDTLPSSFPVCSGTTEGTAGQPSIPRTDSLVVGEIEGVDGTSTRATVRIVSTLVEEPGSDTGLPASRPGPSKVQMAKEDGQWKHCPPYWTRGTGSQRP